MMFMMQWKYICIANLRIGDVTFMMQWNGSYLRIGSNGHGALEVPPHHELLNNAWDG